MGHGDAEKQVKKYTDELNKITLEGLQKNLDYSKLSLEKINKTLSDMGITDKVISDYEAQKNRLNEIALEVKASGGVLTDSAEALKILGDTNYKNAVDYDAAIQIKIAADKLAIDNQTANLKAWADSAFTSDQLQEQAFDTFKAKSEDLAKWVADMSKSVADGGDGFTDAELSYALANAAFIKTTKEATDAIDLETKAKDKAADEARQIALAESSANKKTYEYSFLSDTDRQKQLVQDMADNFFVQYI